MRYIMLAIILFILFLPPAKPAIVWDELEPYAYAGLLTSLSVQESLPDAPDVPEVTDCDCNGTKKVTYDGSAYVDCPCDNCSCKRNARSATEPVAEPTPKIETAVDPPKRTRVILITDTQTCPPCRKVDVEVVQKLNTKAYADQGWSSGEDESNTLQVLEYPEKKVEIEAIMKEIGQVGWGGTIPTFIRLDGDYNEKEDKKVGSIDIYEFIVFKQMGNKRATYSRNNNRSMMLNGVEWPNKQTLIYHLRMDHGVTDLIEGLSARDLKYMHDDAHAENIGKVLWN